jgi:hypothetical protein
MANQIPVPNHTVTLSVDEHGNFTFAPTLLRVDQGESIQFNCAGSFEVMFKERSPGNRLYLWEGDSILTIDPDAEYAVYHYAAAIKKGDRVFLDAACGDIAVGT